MKLKGKNHEVSNRYFNYYVTLKRVTVLRYSMSTERVPTLA